MKQLVTPLAVVLFSIASIASSAQKKFRIEKVTREDLEMTSYDRDTSASAVVLFNIGRFRSDNFEFMRQMRVKILNKAGLEWGNWVFNTPLRGDFKVVVYNLVNGEVVSEKAGANSVYEEEVLKSYYVSKVFAPGVRAGSIIDITYTHPGIPFEWWFQERIPVAYSELVLEPHQAITVNTAHFGFEPVKKVSDVEWQAFNLPAFETEPFLNDYTNYITKFRIHVTSVSLNGPWGGHASWHLYYQDLGRSWSAVNRILLDFQGFSDVVKGPMFVNDIAREIRDKNLPPKARIEEAFRKVQENIKYNGANQIFCTGALRSNFVTDHSGTVADVNLTLIGLLNKLDIKTYPVVLSTRESGLLLEHAPSLRDLNYVVGYIRHDDINMFVDATSEDVPPGMLPVRCLNGRGLIIKEGGEEWIDLESGQSETKRQFVTVKLTKNGTATASVANDYSGYGFTNWYNQSKEINYDAQLVANKIQKAIPEMKVLKYHIDRNEPAKASSKETYDLDVSDLVIDAGDNLMFTPFLLNDYASNPFKSEGRRYPIDMSYQRDMSATVTVQLDGLAPAQLPPSEKFSTPDGSAVFTFISGASGNVVQLRMILKITRSLYTETEYQELRRFFSEVARKVTSPIELKKI